VSPKGWRSGPDCDLLQSAELIYLIGRAEDAPPLPFCGLGAKWARQMGCTGGGAFQWGCSLCIFGSAPLAPTCIQWAAWRRDSLVKYWHANWAPNCFPFILLALFAASKTFFATVWRPS